MLKDFPMQQATAYRLSQEPCLRNLSNQDGLITRKAVQLVIQALRAY